MPKCDVNKLPLQLYWNHTSALVFSYKFAAYFQITFSQEHLWVAASAFFTKKKYMILKNVFYLELQF